MSRPFEKLKSPFSSLSSGHPENKNYSVKTIKYMHIIMYTLHSLHIAISSYMGASM